MAPTSLLLGLLALAVSSVSAAPTPASDAAAAAAPSLYLAGDSTMVKSGNNDGTEGWGAAVVSDMNIPIINNAIAGRSARSFTREGRFTAMAQSVKQGDYVVIEFGHNDGGSLTPMDNGRTDCNPVNGNYASTCQTTYNGTAETVLTYEAYLVNAAKLFQSKGANVVLSTATPNNVWETGTFTYSASRFVGYVRDAANATGATFVDHGQATADAYQKLGAQTVDSYYPNDHTHTSPAGATTVAQAFITALKGTSSTLKAYAK